MKLYKFSIVLSFFMLTGCGHKYDISPNKLPEAHVGKSYTQFIKITGGKVSEQHFELNSNIPEDQEIKITPVDDIDGYNHLKIDGIPKYKGKYEIIINAHFYGRGDDKLNKTYEFVVKE
ncbi:hypothetical protein KTI56_15535 [Acinetobacter pittii]|uniref:hypothetical protein n=2 Tax=Moraxellaceae TaxID=468 RepID=UPI0002D5086C|nr:MULTISPECIES: hypothetical protein [Acinetobacter]EHU1559431.1 hypothetical protein [Acinetobacter baumannii]MDR0066489.1 hypothetical protein [Acinetobacter sp. 11520]MDU6284197.1 hypothetical protein [Acinetobacter sp.]AMM27918.1 hypothetical protein AYJ52_05460 [Acinetobacter pittii]EXB00175.1 hypothetical protein J507_1076 [Acinetobacter sp. 1295259]